MDSPGTTLDPTERALEQLEKEYSQRFTDKYRLSLSKQGSIDWDKEVSSHSERFGYIFRYPMITRLEQDGEVTTFQHTLVCWSKDLEEWTIETF